VKKPEAYEEESPATSSHYSDDSHFSIRREGVLPVTLNSSFVSSNDFPFSETRWCEEQNDLKLNKKNEGLSLIKQIPPKKPLYRRSFSEFSVHQLPTRFRSSTLPSDAGTEIKWKRLQIRAAKTEAKQHLSQIKVNLIILWIIILNMNKNLNRKVEEKGICDSICIGLKLHE